MSIKPFKYSEELTEVGSVKKFTAQEARNLMEERRYLPSLIGIALKRCRSAAWAGAMGVDIEIEDFSRPVGRDGEKKVHVDDEELQWIIDELNSLEFKTKAIDGTLTVSWS